MKGIYQHFRPEEKDTIDMFNSKFEIASRDYFPVLLDFLDPRERLILESVSGGYDDVDVYYYGGGRVAGGVDDLDAAGGRLVGEERERMRALLVPSLLTFEVDDFEITVFDMRYPDKFVSLEHRNVLGAIMNVGVDRSKIGDIVIWDDIQFAIATPYKALFVEELERIKRAPVKLREVPVGEFVEMVDDGVSKRVLSSSMRLDTVLSNVVGEGRAKSRERVEKGKVKVNHIVVEDPSFVLEVGDVVSVRHYGRVKLVEWLGETKKDKHRLMVKVYSGK